MKKLVVALIFVVFVLSLGTVGWLWHSLISSPMNENSVNEIVFEVKPGSSLTKVAYQLQESALIRNAQAFVVYAQLTGQTGSMKVGEYSLNQAMTPQQIINVIASGISIARKFTVSEGLNIYEIGKIFEEKGLLTQDDFLKIVRDPETVRNLLGESAISLEGFLFPETYQYTKYTKPREIIELMVANALEAFQEVTAKDTLPGWTRNQIMTLASIIEKETGATFERPLISSVFHNRLNKKMKLQTDPTIIYGIFDETGKFEIKISREDIRRPTRFNTYVIDGLPPGPIANPGREAILAAVKPESSEYLFFVSQNDGTHIFSKSYQDHNKAVQRYQKNPKAREGKSWRDLNRKKKSTN
ncbi:MAG: endolytic transglycosylase MltG [Pseudobdellovibrionaceae bacterium]|jgi:UPF0755 protein